MERVTQVKKIEIEDSVIKVVDDYKLLGVAIDKELIFQAHIKNLEKGYYETFFHEKIKIYINNS